MLGTSILVGILGLLMPLTADAQVLSAVVDAVSGPLMRVGGNCAGPGCFVAIVISIMNAARLLIAIAASVLIVRSGMVLLYRSDDEQLSTAKRTIASALSAIILFYLAPSLVDAFYGGLNVGSPTLEGGTVLEGAPDVGVAILTDEIMGLIRWAGVPIAAVAVLMIIVSGVRAVFSFGTDQSVSQIRNTVIGVVSGLLLLGIRQAILLTFGLRSLSLPGAPSAAPIIVRAIQMTQAFMIFIGIIAVAMFIFAGVMMILNLGNQEQFTKARQLMLQTALGISIVGVSYMLVNFISEVVIG